MTHDQLEQIIRTHQAMVYRYLLATQGPRLMSPRMSAPETFLAAYKSSTVPLEDSTVEGGRCAAWIRGVARNQLLMYFRKARSTQSLPIQWCLNRRHKQRLLDEAWAAELPAVTRDGFDYAEALQNCLARLQGTQRKVLDMFYGEEFSRAQIAEALNMSEDGIKSLLRRVRAPRLRQCVQTKLGGSGLGGSRIGGTGPPA